MFKKLLSRIKEVIGVTGADVYGRFGLSNPSSSQMETAVQSWREIYKGNMPWLDRNRQSLRLASTIANKIATTVTVESKIEDKIGLAHDTLSDPNKVERTATKIIPSEQSTYGFATGIQRAQSRPSLRLPKSAIPQRSVTKTVATCYCNLRGHLFLDIPEKIA